MSVWGRVRNFFSRSADLGRRRRDAPIIGEVIRGNYGALGAGPWHELVSADWLGPCTPHRVPAWQLRRMRRDTQLSLGLQVIRSTFVGLEWRVRGGNPTTRAFVQKELRESPLWNHLLRSGLNALDFGFQAIESIWEQRDVTIEAGATPGTPGTFHERAYVMSDLCDLDPALVRLKVDEFGHLTGLVFGSQELSLEKMLLATNNLEFRNWYGTSILLPSYLPWYWCSWLYAWLMRYAEGRINPAILATAPWDVRAPDPNDPDKKEANAVDIAVREAGKIRGGAIAGLPYYPDPNAPGVNQFSLTLMKDEGRADQFVRIIEHMQAQKLRGLGIPEKTVQQDKQGSYAIAEIHLDAFLSMLEERKQHTLIPFFNEASRAITRANFGRSAPAPYFEGSELARAKQAVLTRLAEVGYLVPQVLDDGREWRPIDLVDMPRVLEACDMPLRGTPMQIAKTRLPQQDPVPVKTGA